MSDLIRRADAIKALYKAWGRGWIEAKCEWIAEACKQTLDALPTVEPERGEWQEKETFNNEDSIIEHWQSARCSMCEKYHTTPYMYYFNDYNFCPNCGADMRKGADDEVR